MWRIWFAAGFAERAVKTVERDEGQTVDADQPRHAGDIVTRRRKILLQAVAPLVLLLQRRPQRDEISCPSRRF